MNILKTFPNPKELLNWYKNLNSNEIYEVNGHVHTPFSFSAFADIPQIFEMAKKENIKVVGINDFFVADGYPSFYDEALKSKVFPLFNIEFIGLMKEEQAKGIRINDPNNPGRCYFSGKGLDYPFNLPENQMNQLKSLISESQEQVKCMIDKANKWFKEIGLDIELNYNQIKEKFAKELVRERHIAKAIRIAIFEKSSINEERKELFKHIYGGKESKVDINDAAALENEIRGNLLKSGGKAFVEEDDKAFLSLNQVIELIIKAGGIPCYPVLLDDKNGNYTDYESDKQLLYEDLKKRNIACIELIPGRNDYNHFKEFVSFFDSKGFVITFGTEHNAPDMIPLTCDTRGKKLLDKELRKISFEGTCVIAAHQYLKSKGMDGFIDKNGIPKTNEKQYFIELGRAVIEKFIKN
jgi:hypothetical protein